jgi:hypothetical protein
MRQRWHLTLMSKNDPHSTLVYMEADMSFCILIGLHELTCSLVNGPELIRSEVNEGSDSEVVEDICDAVNSQVAKIGHDASQKGICQCHSEICFCCQMHRPFQVGKNDPLCLRTMEGGWVGPQYNEFPSCTDEQSRKLKEPLLRESHCVSCDVGAVTFNRTTSCCAFGCQGPRTFPFYLFPLDERLISRHNAMHLGYLKDSHTLVHFICDPANKATSSDLISTC